MATSSHAKAPGIQAHVMTSKYLHYSWDRADNDFTAFIRCNGREFQIEMSPFFFCDSPAIAARYDKFMSAVRDLLEGDPEDEEDHPEVVQERFYDWLVGVFEPVF